MTPQISKILKSIQFKNSKLATGVQERDMNIFNYPLPVNEKLSIIGLNQWSKYVLFRTSEIQKEWLNSKILLEYELSDDLTLQGDILNTLFIET